MKLIGQVTLVFRDKDTGEITKEITKENNISNYWIEAILNPNVSDNFGDIIFISDHVPYGAATDPNIKASPRTHPYGFEVTPKTVFEPTDSNFAYCEYHHRFSAPGSDITINTIGLTDDTSVDADNVITPVQAWVKLSVPCTQTTIETLDVYYRIIAPYDYYLEPSPADIDSTGISGEMSYWLIRRVCQNSSTEWFTSVQTNWNGNVDHTRLASVASESNSHDSSAPYTGTTTISAKTDVHKMEAHTEITIADAIGALAGYIGYGGCTTNSVTPWTRGISDPNNGVIQSIFGHTTAATGPFHDNPTPATADGTIALNGDSWTNPDFPKMYRLDITNTGAVGVSTYQFMVRNHFGFVGNNYKDAFRLCSTFKYKNSHMYDGFTFAPADNLGDVSQNKNRPTWVPYITFGTAIAVNKDAICVVDISKETGVTFDSTLYPTFTPTNITQVTFEPGGTIYVGCRESGIYKITDPTGSPTVTKIDSSTTGLGSLAGSPDQTKCYGVSYGNSRLWAMFDGGLFSSTDSGATWSQANFSNPIITAGGSPAVSSWNLVKYIKADKTHADQRLAIVYDSGGTTVMEMSVLWWDEASSLGSPAADTSINGPQFIAWNRTPTSSIIRDTRILVDEPWTYFLMFEPSPTGNKWGANAPTGLTTSQPSTLYPAYFTFGSTGKIQTVSSDLSNYQTYCSWEYDSSGDENICVVAFQTTYNYQFALYKDDTTYVVSKFRNSNDDVQGNNTATADGPVMYVGNMIHFFWRPDLTESWYGITSMNEVNSVDGNADFQHLLWDKYGWNGAAWELDHAGSKTTHAGAEVLSDGVTVAFDDDSGTQTFVDTEYYTFGVCKGVWLDGSTTIDLYTGVYFKKYVTGQTGLESGTLSAATRTPDIFEIYPPTGTYFTWQDTNNVNTGTNDVLRTAAGNDPSYDAGARSNEVLNSNTGFTNKAGKDVVHGKFMFGLYSTVSVIGEKIACGLSSSAVLGNPIDRDTIEYGIEVVALGPGVGDGFQADVNIIESGVTVGSSVLRIGTNSVTEFSFEIEILNDGTVNYYMWNEMSTTVDYSIGIATDEKLLLHTSTGAPIVDYYIDVAINTPSTSKGINVSYTAGVPNNIQDRRGTDGTPQPRRRFCQRVSADYFHIFGEFGNSNGRYLPNFFAVDSTQGLSVLINGVEAQRIADNDLTTTLLAGEISVFPREGCFRYSASDTGKTVTASYNCLTTE